MADTTRQQELNKLRAEAMRASRLTTRKLNRVKRDLGVGDLQKYQPRIEPATKLKKYTAKQLKAYIQQSEKFRDRKNQFVKLGQTGVTTRERWEKFDRVQQQRIARVKSEWDKVKDHYIPTVNQTVEQRRDSISPPKARQLEGNTMYDTARTPEQLVSEKALDRLEARLSKENRYRSEGRRQKIALGDSIEKMFGDIPGVDTKDPDLGGKSIRQAIRGLSPDQFLALAQLRDFMSSLAQWYEDRKLIAGEAELDAGKQSAYDARENDSHQTIKGLIIDVSKIGGTGR